MLPKIYCYPCGLTLSAPFVATFPLAVSLLLFCPVVYMEPTLSSFSKALNCFRFIDLFAPYSSNNLSTKDCATGPFKLRASSCEKTWESVVLMRAKRQRRGKTVQAFAESIDELYKKAPFCSATLSYALYAGKHVKFWSRSGKTNRDFGHDLKTLRVLCNRAFLKRWTSPVPGSQDRARPTSTQCEGLCFSSDGYLFTHNLMRDIFTVKKYWLSGKPKCAISTP